MTTWDTPYDATSRNLAILAHLAAYSGLILPAAAPIAIPAIIAATRADDPFARAHAIESLNFQITMWVAAFVSAALTCVLVGFVMLAVVAVVGVVMPIFATMAASRGEGYRYPFTVRLFS